MGHIGHSNENNYILHFKDYYNLGASHKPSFSHATGSIWFRTIGPSDHLSSHGSIHVKTVTALHMVMKWCLCLCQKTHSDAETQLLDRTMAIAITYEGQVYCQDLNCSRWFRPPARGAGHEVAAWTKTVTFCSNFGLALLNIKNGFGIQEFGIQLK